MIHDFHEYEYEYEYFKYVLEYTRTEYIGLRSESIIDWFGQTDDWLWKSSRFPTLLLTQVQR